MEAEEDTGEEPDQSSHDLPKKTKKKKSRDENNVKTKSIPKNKRNSSEVQDERHSDTSEKKTSAVVGLSDTDVALRSITVKIRNKLLFNSSVMEGGWFDQVLVSRNFDLLNK